MWTALIISNTKLAVFAVSIACVMVKILHCKYTRTYKQWGIPKIYLVRLNWARWATSVENWMIWRDFSWTMIGLWLTVVYSKKEVGVSPRRNKIKFNNVLNKNQQHYEIGNSRMPGNFGTTNAFSLHKKWKQQSAWIYVCHQLLLWLNTSPKWAPPG